MWKNNNTLNVLFTPRIINILLLFLLNWRKQNDIFSQDGQWRLIKCNIMCYFIDQDSY